MKNYVREEINLENRPDRTTTLHKTLAHGTDVDITISIKNLNTLDESELRKILRRKAQVMKMKAIKSKNII